LDTSCFDEKYLAGLRDRDPEAEAHFVSHFRLPIWLKARRHLRAPDLVEDACQETMVRVLGYFRAGKRLDNPASLPAFVCSVCHHVALEMIRSQARYHQIAETTPDPVDTRADAYRDVVTEERKQLVREILNQLSEKDRSLLQAALWEETDREELCRRFRATPDHLRVLLHRARVRFREALQKSEGPAARGLGAG
jgi:RNA polymerase sigma-70 factor (ECF subfamily)